MSYKPERPAVAVDGWEAVLPELDDEDDAGWDQGFGNGSRFSSPWVWFLADSSAPVPQFSNQ